MKKSLTTVFVIFSFLFIQNGQRSMSNTNYTVTSSDISGGGAPMSSSEYYSDSTLGQTVIQEPVPSENYDLYFGFGYTMFTRICIWSQEPEAGDGDVDGADVYLFIGPDYNPSEIENFGSEYGRTHCFDWNE